LPSKAAGKTVLLSSHILSEVRACAIGEHHPAGQDRGGRHPGRAAAPDAHQRWWWRRPRSCPPAGAAGSPRRRARRPQVPLRGGLRRPLRRDDRARGGGHQGPEAEPLSLEDLFRRHYATSRCPGSSNDGQRPGGHHDPAPALLAARRVLLVLWTLLPLCLCWSPLRPFTPWPKRGWRACSRTSTTMR
jgi:hypothetical protein